MADLRPRCSRPTRRRQIGSRMGQDLQRCLQSPGDTLGPGAVAQQTPQQTPHLQGLPPKQPHQLLKQLTLGAGSSRGRQQGVKQLLLIHLQTSEPTRIAGLIKDSSRSLPRPFPNSLEACSCTSPVSTLHTWRAAAFPWPVADMLHAGVCRHAMQARL